MAVPKKRQSNSRQKKRRASHDRINPPTIVVCSNCSEPKLPHRVCKSCGYYDGQKIIEVAEE